MFLGNFSYTNKAIKLIIDPENGAIVEANTAACNFYGYAEEELLAKKIYDINVMSPESTDRAMQKAIHEDQALFCFKHRLASGEVRDVEVYSGPVIESDKNMLYSIVHDVTGRKQAEDALRDSETRLRSLVRTIPDLIWLKDQNGVYLSCNPRFERFFGAKEKDIIGKTDYDFIDKKMADSFRSHDQLAIEKGQASLNEEEIKFADDGHREIIETIKTPMYADDGKLTGVLGIGRDITRRKQAEEALKRSHRRFLTVLNSIDSNIYVADMQTHKVLFMNKHMIDDFGQDMTGDDCWAAFRCQSEPCSDCVSDQLIDEDGKPTDVYVWQEKHPVTGRWYINHVRAIEWTDGRLVRFQIATDITELKKKEDDLRQAHKMDALGTLAGGIAHDFNNILSAIFGYTELSIDDVEKGSHLEDNLNEIFKAAKRAKDLVNQILTFARQSDDELKPIRVDLIVKEVIKFMRSSIPSTIDLRQNIASDSLILGDSTQIHEILMNLCSNAAYAMEEGSGILEVSLKDITIGGTSGKVLPGLQPGNYMELKVSDTGTGIPADIIQAVFEPYFTTKPAGEGTGMGLAMVHGMVTNHGGKIAVDSKLGQGSVFTIYLPVTRKRTTHDTGKPERLPAGTERILFVDDEAAITRMTSQVLKRLGYQVTIRTSSLEALELFKSKPNEFDLVISDMTMPNLTGDLLAIELMNIRPDIPVILCTGYSKKISDESATRIGIKALIYKPLVKAELAQVIRSVLNRKQPP